MTATSHLEPSTWTLVARAPSPWPRVWAFARPLALALAITLVQVAAVFTIEMLARPQSPAEVYESLCRWDGNLYSQIVERGYRSDVRPAAPVDFQRTNVAFFPGYPLAGKLVWRASGQQLSPRASLVVAAQIAAWGFWCYWFLFLARFKADRPAALAATAVLTLHPTAFFLVVAYSESLFLLGLVGFFYWIARPARYWPLAALHGIVLSATRMGGLPVAFCPLAAQMLIEAGGNVSLSAAVAAWKKACAKLTGLFSVGMISSLGGLGFFAWCQWRFGSWSVYMQTQQAGWNVHADWFFFLRPVNYMFFGSSWHPNVLWPDDLSRLVTWLTLAALVWLARYEWRLARQQPSGWQSRLPLYLAAFGLWFLHAAGVSPILLKSMIRYCLPVHALVLVNLVNLHMRGCLPAWTSRSLKRFAIALVGLLVLQLALAWRFFNDRWIA